MNNIRLINKLFEDENFLVDSDSLPYVVRDIINMNWWNTCDYLLGYKNNRRIYIDYPTHNMKLIAIVTKEFYRHNQNAYKNEGKLKKELKNYISGKNNSLRQLKLYSMDYRRNDSQYFYKNNKPTWLDCTSRATYAWKYVAQNGYIDFDGICRVIDGNKIIKHCKEVSAYPHKEEICSLFDRGVNLVKKEIFSQNKYQDTIDYWVKKLDIKVIESRKWLYDKIAHVKTDPYKNNEKKLLKRGLLLGNNELQYGYKTSFSASGATYASSTRSNASRASYATYASCAISASDASRASRASGASNASDASNASNASSASDAASYATTYVSRASHASDVIRASNVSGASHVSGASDASSASNVSSARSRASDASRASNASHASSASDASRAGSASDANVIRTSTQHENWFDVPTAIGKIVSLEHPPVFMKNKFGIAGFWKINSELVKQCKLGWFDPFMGHGESPIYARRHNKNYVGIEINPDSMHGYLLPYVKKAVNESFNPTLFNKKNTKVELLLGDSSIYREELKNKFDLCYTSPPYFNFEDYGFHNKIIKSCVDYDEYHKRVTVPVFTNVKKYLISSGILAIQSEKNDKLKNKWIKVIESIGFKLLKDTITGQEQNKYSKLSKRDQTLLIFIKD